ncbi:MAG: hypothetical protein ACI9BW_004537, partial [Gammaproteobacteria bacterium]
CFGDFLRILYASNLRPNFFSAGHLGFLSSIPYQV